jgi:hypothetical protein
MAGPYAHILVCEQASKSATLDEDLRHLLETNACLRSLGAVSPDLPAIWDKLPVVGGGNWSNRFHTINDTREKKIPTNLVVEKAFAEIRSMKDDKARFAGLVWLLGYVGHVVTDVVIHPVVRQCIKQATSQGVSDGGVLHQRVEIVMDTMLVRALLKKEEVADAPVLNWLENANRDPERAQVMAAWSKAIREAYGESADPALWYKYYVDALSIANDSPFQFRGYTYPQFADIPGFERTMYYDDLVLPNDTLGPYTGVFNLAVAKVADRWSTVWNRWTSGADLKGVIPNWDLNSGQNYTAGIEHDLWPEGPELVLRPPVGGLPPPMA